MLSHDALERGSRRMSFLLVSFQLSSSLSLLRSLFESPHIGPRCFIANHAAASPSRGRSIIVLHLQHFLLGYSRPNTAPSRGSFKLIR